MTYDDPGWVPPLGLLVTITVLPFVQLIKRWGKGRPTLVVLRTAVVANVVRLALFGSVLPPLDLKPNDNTWILFLVAGSGVYSLGASWWFARALGSKLIMANDEAALSRAYSGLSFIQMGLVLAPALFGFVGVFIIGHPWVYLVGLPFSLLGLAWSAPTARDIRRRQDQMDSQGRPVSLGRALMEPMY